MTVDGVTVDVHPTYGRVLKATQAFAPGDTVLCEEPLVCATRQWDAEDPAFKDILPRLVPHVLAMHRVCEASQDVQRQVLDMHCPDLHTPEDVIAGCREAAQVVAAQSGRFTWGHGFDVDSLQRYCI